MVQQNSMTCSTDGKTYYKELRQKYLSENYHLEEKYVKIIFNCIHNRVCKDMQWTNTADHVQSNTSAWPINF
jgi:hypothetical protein